MGATLRHIVCLGRRIRKVLMERVEAIGAMLGMYRGGRMCAAN